MAQTTANPVTDAEPKPKNSSGIEANSRIKSGSDTESGDPILMN